MSTICKDSTNLLQLSKMYYRDTLFGDTKKITINLKKSANYVITKKIEIKKSFVKTFLFNI